MSGWNIIYGLINFAILAVGLYLIGRKLVTLGSADETYWEALALAMVVFATAIQKSDSKK